MYVCSNMHTLLPCYYSYHANSYVSFYYWFIVDICYCVLLYRPRRNSNELDELIHWMNENYILSVKGLSDDILSSANRIRSIDEVIIVVGNKGHAFNKTLIQRVPLLFFLFNLCFVTRYNSKRNTPKPVRALWVPGFTYYNKTCLGDIQCFFGKSPNQPVLEPWWKAVQNPADS